MLEVIEYWVLCQKNWLYLESIFSAIDIQRYYSTKSCNCRSSSMYKTVMHAAFRQLTSEAKLFLQADKSWRDVIRLITDKPTALKATNTPGYKYFLFTDLLYTLDVLLTMFICHKINTYTCT